MGYIYKIKSLRADGAYDTDNSYKLCNQYNFKTHHKAKKKCKNLQQYIFSIRKKQQHYYKANLPTGERR